MLDIYEYSDSNIAINIGSFVKNLRLNKNITQKQLSDLTKVSLNSIKSLEKGKGKLIVLVTILRELQALEYLHIFLEQPNISPLQLAKSQGKTRKRAFKRSKNKNKEDSEW